MDLPVYLRVLWLYKGILAAGLVIALLAGGAAGYTVQDGTITSRTEKTYTATATVLVTSKSNPLFQAEIPGQTLALGETAATIVDLAQTTVVYAYIVSGSEIRRAVEAEIGPLAPDETITALRRTKQPAEDERFPGRLTLPVLDVVGSSSSPMRAEQISAAANAAFQAYVVKQQVSQKVAKSNRVQLTTLTENAATERADSNPLIPVAITFVGVFWIFLALTFVLYNIRASKDRAARRRGVGGTVTDDSRGAPARLREDSLAGAPARN